ncbi:helix-turn-helix transcriptional regulator [Shouchella clausii]|uniref:helix-turn-helix transcriptional regulator n=1 Tax=Shouchella clausii TaxID=79880 RepID=UPI001C730592|nr:YafY family protein [Shouchella clausii]MBX0320361.1 YafY family transcriptional regulator [Shouchella clausii]
MKLDRLLGITMELMTKKRVTATELASRFEVSVRTIYRDIDWINQSGIPVASFSGTDGGFELMNGFFLTKQHFSIDDFSVIYNLLKSVESSVSGPKFTTLINKLSSLQPALLNGERQDKIIFGISASEGEKEMVFPLMEAVDKSKRISLTYTDAACQVSERKIEPLNLLWERGVWYLDGYCLSRKDKRYFRVSRMANLEVLDEPFHPKAEYKRPVQEHKQGTNAHLRFDLIAQPRVFEQFPEKFIHHGDFIDVQTIFYSRDYAVSVILSYGAKVKIISPNDLKDDLAQTINDIQKLYFD